MNTHTKPIPIFSVGRHTDMSGTTLEITEADLEKTVLAYQPSRHEAPLVAGHPQHDAPAWGWVASLSLVDGILLATPSQVDPAFAEQVAAGRYKKISASFYTPNAPSNPVPGVYYLRHVGFLGAQPPAVKGLPDAAFREGEQVVVIMETQTSGEDDARELTHAPAGAQWTDPSHHDVEQTMSTKENQMSDMPEQQESPDSHDQPLGATPPDVLALQRKEAALNAREVQFAEREAQLRVAEREIQQHKRMTSTLQFVEELVQRGQILPRHREGLATFMASLDEASLVEFSEPGEQEGAETVVVKTSSESYFKKFLKELPPLVEFSERSADVREKDMPAGFAVPDGYEVDAVGLATHQKILSYAQANNMDFVSAALAVSG